MAGILELSDWELKTTMVHMLRALMDKVESMQEQIDNVSREVEILRKNQENLLEIKNTHRNEKCLCCTNTLRVSQEYHLWMSYLRICKAADLYSLSLMVMATTEY